VIYEKLRINKKLKLCSFKQNRACSLFSVPEQCWVQVCCSAGTFPSASGSSTTTAQLNPYLQEPVCGKDLPSLLSTNSASLGACALANCFFGIQVALDHDPRLSAVTLTRCFCRAAAHVACPYPGLLSRAQIRHPRGLLSVQEQAQDAQRLRQCCACLCFPNTAMLLFQLLS